MKKESARSLRLTAEALAALKVLSCESPDKSQGDVVSMAILEKAGKVSMAPVIRFGILDPQQLPFIQLEATMAERRLRELSQKILRVRPQDKDQADKLATVISKVEAELEETRKLRIGLAKVARLGAELTAEDQGKVRKMIKWTLNAIEDPKNAAHIATLELQLRINRAFLMEE